MSEYITVIGIEVHLQLSTKTKAFCSCPNLFGAPPNTLTCPICLGHPGTLPVPNKKVIEYAIASALALNCTINANTRYDRKNYFYPDLPKGFQISQYNIPLAEKGFLEFYAGDDWSHPTRWGITRVHLEEDTAKIIHTDDGALLDFNRAGVPLMEIVSEPMVSSPPEAYYYLRALKATMLTLGVSTCNMEEGSLRCDTNISVGRKGEGLGTKVEIKNLNSFRAVRLALEYERDRQVEILSNGGEVVQETRLWNEKMGITEPMRGKEETADYRYFPEPDIPPIVIDKKWIDEIEKNMPSLPIERMNTLKVAGVGIQEATTIVERPDLYAYFDECLKYHDNKRSLVNWIIGELNAIAQKKGIDYSDIPVRPKHLAELVRNVDGGKVGASAGKEVLLKMWETGKSPDELISEMGVERISDEDTIIDIINEVVGENPEVVASILKGKDKAIGRLIGEVMRKSGGSADPGIVKKLLSEKIEKMKEVN